MKEIQQDILDYIRERREANITELGYHLGLGSTEAREHLTRLERAGLVRSHEQRDGVGRPTIRYQLSDSGEAAYAKQYDQLASALLESLSDDARRHELLEQAGERLARADAAVAEPIGTSAQKRVEAACQELRAKNVVADWEQVDDALLLYQYTCPYPDVAMRTQDVCAVEVAYLRAITGLDPVLVESKAKGADRCVFRMPARADRAHLTVLS